MKRINIEKDIPVFGIEVKTFPLGIGEAFEKLIKTVPGGFTRSFYGISYVGADGKMVYYAVAEEASDGEAEKFSCERLVIEKGEYLAEPLKNWRSQTDCIKDVFMAMIKDDRCDKTKPAIEWYKNNDEMLCMLKIKN